MVLLSKSDYSIDKITSKPHKKIKMVAKIGDIL